MVDKDAIFQLFRNVSCFLLPPDTNDKENHQRLLREMKDRFTERDYMAIFLSSPDHLLVYFYNYVPSRSLCYHSLFSDSLVSSILTGRQLVLDRELLKWRQDRCLDPSVRRPFSVEPVDRVQVLSIGSGAGSELIALSRLIYTACATKLNDPIPKNACTFTQVQDYLEHSTGLFAREVELVSTDIADWTLVQQTLSNEIRSLWFPDDARLQLRWIQNDVLSEFGDDESSSSDRPVISPFFASADLITFMFVFNELFQVSKRKTARMLTALVKSMKSGSHLLVIESAGSFSQLKVGRDEMMVYRLLDGIRLLQVVERHDAKWYRFAPDLLENSPFPLNNMRYFYRLYQKK
jgi:25S rRNA (uracil2843-N3)-methyltransferase